MIHAAEIFAIAYLLRYGLVTLQAGIEILGMRMLQMQLRAQAAAGATTAAAAAGQAVDDDSKALIFAGGAFLTACLRFELEPLVKRDARGLPERAKRVRICRSVPLVLQATA